MTISPERRRTLPLVRTGTRHGNRSWDTCYYRCGNACDHPEPNPTGHEHVRSVVETALARRTVLGGMAAAGGAALVLGPGSPAAAAPGGGSGGSSAATGDWTPVPPNVRDNVTVPAGWTTTLVAAWGDPVLPGAPAFDPYAQSPESAAMQFGFNCDYVGVLPLGRQRALLVVNHEYTNEAMMFPEGTYDDDTVRRIAIESHGMSVLEVQRSGGARGGGWRPVNPSATKHNRRVTGNTPLELTGPAAGHERLRTTADPSGRTVLGTLNNCAGGTTPWGTVLSGEENVNQYFSASGAVDPAYAESYARYGFGGSAGRNWAAVDSRFDLSREPHEPFRFGWVVEIDPYDPTSTPRKHTMLGRFKHEGANVVVADDGRVVAYMGDDERGDYLYKFVSAGTVDTGRGRAARRRNLDLLTAGTLYVARLAGDGGSVDPATRRFVPDDGEHDGTGEWVALTSDTTSFVPGMSVAEVLLDTRLAADRVAPTRMDRPEDVEPNPVNRKIYAALTNNSQRGGTVPVDEPNPLGSSSTRGAIGAPLSTSSGNRNGYVLELTEDGGDHTGTSFTWVLMLVCGDPEAPETYFAGVDKSRVSPISCPDNVAFDSVGNLWVSTDGNALGSNDGIFRVPVSGPDRGLVEQFLTVPVGAEACGALITDADRSVWVAVQHPGEGGTFAESASTWPHTDAWPFPRPGVAVAHRA